MISSMVGPKAAQRKANMDAAALLTKACEDGDMHLFDQAALHPVQ